MKPDYTPGTGSYKVDEAASLTGIGTPNNIDSQLGTLTFNGEYV
jgi:hypothetical protein